MHPVLPSTGLDYVAALVTLQPDPLARARLNDALGSVHELRNVGTWTRLWNMVGSAPISACIVDIYAPDSDIRPSRLGRLRQQRPDLAIVVYSDFSGRELDLFELGRHQINAIMQVGVDDSPNSIRSTLDRSLASSAASVVGEALQSSLPAWAAAAIQWSMENSVDRPKVAALAGGMGMSENQLAKELRRHGLPPARTLLVWGRLFQAARLLDVGGQTVEGVAFALGYTSSSALRRAFRLHVGCSPSAVSREGGIARVLKSFTTPYRQDSTSNEASSAARVARYPSSSR